MCSECLWLVRFVAMKQAVATRTMHLSMVNRHAKHLRLHDFIESEYKML